MPSGQPGMALNGQHGDRARELGSAEWGTQHGSAQPGGSGDGNHQSGSRYCAVPQEDLDGAFFAHRRQWEASPLERRLRRGVVLGSGICLVVSVAALLLHQSSRAPHAVEMVDLMPDVAPRDSQSLRPDSIEVESADGLGLDGGKQAANAELKFAASLRKAEDASWAREKADQLVRSLSKIASTTSSQAVEKMPMTSNKVVEAEPVDAVHSPESDDAGA
eukprot:1680716-Rhodomonas_salina.6